MHQLVAERYSDSAGVDSDRHNKAWKRGGDAVQQAGNSRKRGRKVRACRNASFSQERVISCACYLLKKHPTLCTSGIRSRPSPDSLTEELEGCERNRVDGVACVGQKSQLRRKKDPGGHTEHFSVAPQAPRHKTRQTVSKGDTLHLQQ